MRYHPIMTRLQHAAIILAVMGMTGGWHATTEPTLYLSGSSGTYTGNREIGGGCNSATYHSQGKATLGPSFGAELPFRIPGDTFIITAAGYHGTHTYDGKIVGFTEPDDCGNTSSCREGEYGRIGELDNESGTEAAGVLLLGGVSAKGGMMGGFGLRKTPDRVLPFPTWHAWLNDERNQNFIKFSLFTPNVAFGRFDLLGVSYELQSEYVHVEVGISAPTLTFASETQLALDGHLGIPIGPVSLIASGSLGENEYRAASLSLRFSLLPASW